MHGSCAKEARETRWILARDNGLGLSPPPQYIDNERLVSFSFAFVFSFLFFCFQFQIPVAIGAIVGFPQTRTVLSLSSISGWVEELQNKNIHESASSAT
ncbi:hypothetical protein I7I48_03775 [Histoplasma ohiense]|nr:hypothetical protein I7I48_03775 [Histoplasma ohiense (nom. inval.)]